MSSNAPTALIAEDEALLAQALRTELGKQWPQLQVLGLAEDGESAVELALALGPDVLFLDISMPGMTGLQAAQAIIEDWPEGAALPLIVFATAYDQYALQAFEHAAVDYLLKPVQAERLARCVQRLQALLVQRDAKGGKDAATLDAAAVERLRSLLGMPGPAAAVSAPPPLSVIQAGIGATLHMVPVAEVLYFEAADKYVRVVTAQREHLIRLSLRELLPQLPPGRFWQIHRGTVVRNDAIASVTRDEAGKLHLALRERPEQLVVSRMYAHLFKPM
ncbi:MAG TPA: LytTR family DNA-binding domain-containing protein [Methylibium sp.]